MVRIDSVRESNAKGKQLHDLVVVFIGGTGGIGESGNMVGVGSGYRSRTQQPRRSHDEHGRALQEEEKATLQVDIVSLFSIG